MGEDRVADEGTYAIDPAGIRRWIAPGDEVPEGWTAEGEPEAEAPKKPSKSKSS